MIHPHTELRFINESIGYGVFLTQPVPKGTIVWTLCEFDLIFTLQQVTHMSELYREIFDKYAYMNSQEEYVLCWDHARYMNHSCDPSALSLTDNDCIAIRDLEAGDELTCDYAQINYHEQVSCSCNHKNCRRIIGKYDIVSLINLWDKSLKEAFKNLFKVEQPLWKFLKNKNELIKFENNLDAISSASSLLSRDMKAVS